MIDYLRLLHSNLKQEYIELRALHLDKENKQFYTQNFEEAQTWITEHTLTHNLYVGINPRCKAGNGTADNVKRCYWLVLDADGYKLGLDNPQAAYEYSLQYFSLPPQMVVYSGKGAHLYYQIEETTDLEAVKELGKAISDSIGFDCISDAARIIRLPDTYNHKHTPPILTELHYVRSDFIYKLSDLQACLEVTNYFEKFHQKVTKDDSRGYPSRSERDYAVVTAAIRAGMQPYAIAYLFAHSPIGAKAKEQDFKHYIEQTVNKAIKEIKREAKQKATEVENWGFIEQGDCLYKQAGKNIRQVATFTIDPEVLLQGTTLEQGDNLLCNITADNFTWGDIKFTRKAFNSKEAFSRELPLMAWQWLGTNKDTQELLPYLMQKLKEKGLPKRHATPVLGLHGSEFVASSQTLGSEGIKTADTADRVWLPAKRVYTPIEFQQASREEITTLLTEFADLFFNLNLPEVIYPLLGWFAITPLKERYAAEAAAMLPILNLYGTRGSGKTTTIKLMQRLFGYSKNCEYDFNSSLFVLISILSSTNAFPISFAEYRSSSSTPDKIERYIRLAYDRALDNRGNRDQTVNAYELLAPFSISGEDAISDPACLERLIQINLDPEIIKEDSQASISFELLEDMPLGIIGTAYYQYILNRPEQFKHSLKYLKDLFPYNLPDRVRRNFTMVYEGLRLFYDFAASYEVELPNLSYELLAEYLQPAISNVVNIATGRTELLVDQLITDIINGIADSDKQPIPFTFVYEEDNECLYVHLTPAIGWWFQKRTREKLPKLETRAIKQQLRERKITPDSVGSYIVNAGPKTVDSVTRHMHCIDLPAALKAGLDIPDKISVFEFI